MIDNQHFLVVVIVKLTAYLILRKHCGMTKHQRKSYNSEFKNICTNELLQIKNNRRESFEWIK